MELKKIMGLSKALRIICTILYVCAIIGAAAILICMFSVEALLDDPEVAPVIEEIFASAEVELDMGITALNGVLVTALLTLGLMIAILILFRIVLKQMEAGEVFNEDNTKKIDIVAILCIVLAFVPQIATTIALLIATGEFQYNFDLNNIIIAIGAYLLSAIIRYAASQQKALQQIQADLANRYDAEHNNAPNAEDVLPL